MRRIIFSPTDRDEHFVRTGDPLLDGGLRGVLSLDSWPDHRMRRCNGDASRLAHR
jgi:hypothetical protein